MSHNLGWGRAELGDYHVEDFAKCLALNSGYSTLSTGGDVVVTFVYLRGRLDPWGTKGKFCGLPLLLVPGEAG